MGGLTLSEEWLEDGIEGREENGEEKELWWVCKMNKIKKNLVSRFPYKFILPWSTYDLTSGIGKLQLLSL